MKRRETTYAKSKHSRVDREKRVKIEVWAGNLELEDRIADCIVKAWDLETGNETFMQVVSPRKLLAANRSTEIIDMDVPVAARDAGLEERTVVAAYLVEDGVQVAHYVNWPKPFKYLHLQKPKRLKVELDSGAATIYASAEVPVKGVALESDDEAVRFADNLFDLVPEETVSVGVKGASERTAIKTQYLGMLT